MNLPPGSTSKLQVLDVRVSAPFKCILQQLIASFSKLNPQTKIGREQIVPLLYETGQEKLLHQSPALLI